MRALRTPFFCVNPKAYLYGDTLLNLALVADELAGKLDLDVFFTAGHADLFQISSQTKHIIVTAQHMDGITPGKGMGHILPESIVAAGAKATFLNHAEHPMTFNEIRLAITRAKALEIMTIVCADSVAEAKAITMLEPDVIVCEPSELIGTGQTSDPAYMKATNQAIKEISSQTKVLQAAGISTVSDVKNALELGADGTGGTSGIVCADSPEKTLRDMLLEVAKFKEEK